MTKQSDVEAALEVMRTQWGGYLTAKEIIESEIRRLRAVNAGLMEGAKVADFALESEGFKASGPIRGTILAALREPTK